MLGEAARQIAAWRTRFGVRLFLRANVSARQLGRPGFADSVLRIIEDAHIRPNEFGLDISERTLEHVGPEVDANLRELQAAGVRFTVDDFGTGASTVRALRAYPLAQIKLDRSLVDRIDRDGTDTSQEIIALAVNLAGSLGAEVVAEGVERTEQLERLRTLRCTRFQGFLASPAQSGEAITELLEQGRFAFAD